MCDREQPWARLKVPKLFYNTTACNELHSKQLCLFTRNISKLYTVLFLVFGSLDVVFFSVQGTPPSMKS